MSTEAQPNPESNQQQPSAAPSVANEAGSETLARQEFHVLAIAIVLPLLMGVAFAGLVFGALELVKGNLGGLIAFLIGLGLGGLVVRLVPRVRLLV